MILSFTDAQKSVLMNNFRYDGLRGWRKLDTFTLFPSFLSLSWCRRCGICLPDCITRSLERIQGLNFGGKVFKKATFQINHKDIYMLAWHDVAWYGTLLLDILWFPDSLLDKFIKLWHLLLSSLMFWAVMREMGIIIMTMRSDDDDSRVATILIQLFHYYSRSVTSRKALEVQKEWSEALKLVIY